MARKRLKKITKIPEIMKVTYMTVLSIFLLFPFALMLFMSVKDRRQIVFEFFSISRPFHWSNYAIAFRHIRPLVINSVIMAVGAMVMTAFVASIAGYAFAKLDFPFKRFLFGILFVKMMLPGIMTLIPSFILAMRLGILDTYWPVILFAVGRSQPFWVFVMRIFVSQQPEDLFESMRLDGAGEFGIFIYLAVPLLRPMIALMSINVFIGVWNDYIWPLVTIPTFSRRPLTVGLAHLTQANPGDFGMLTAGYTLAAIPLLLLFLLSMRQFVEGLTAGAIKL